MAVKRRHLGRTRQPNQFVGFNEDDGLFSGLVAVIDPVSGRNLLTQVADVNTGVKTVTTQVGLALGTGTTFGVGASDIILTDYKLTDTACSVFVQYLTHLKGGGNLGRLWHKTATANGQERCNIAGTASALTVVRSTSNGNGVVNIDYPRGTDDVPHDVVFTSDGVNNTGTAWYLDGVSQSSLTTGAGTATDTPDSTTPFYLGNRASDSLRNWDGWIGYYFRWNRILSAAEARKMHDNPYRLFKIRRTRRTVSSDVTVTCTVGNAVAAGQQASINDSIVFVVGNAVADGTRANINDSDIAGPGNAVAAGAQAALNLSIVTVTGNAVADGITANIVGSGPVVIPAGPGDATADGILAVVTNGAPPIIGGGSGGSGGGWQAEKVRNKREMAKLIEDALTPKLSVVAAISLVKEAIKEPVNIEKFIEALPKLSRKSPDFAKVTQLKTSLEAHITQLAAEEEAAVISLLLD